MSVPGYFVINRSVPCWHSPSKEFSAKSSSPHLRTAVIQVSNDSEYPKKKSKKALLFKKEFTGIRKKKKSQTGFGYLHWLSFIFPFSRMKNVWIVTTLY